MFIKVLQVLEQEDAPSIKYPCLVNIDEIKSICFVSATEAELKYKGTLLLDKKGEIIEDWILIEADRKVMVALFDSFKIILAQPKEV